MDRLQDFAAWLVGLITVVLIVLVAVYIGYIINHPCKQYGEPYFHSPTYVMSGKILVPVGGGVYGDCQSR